MNKDFHDAVGKVIGVRTAELHRIADLSGTGEEAVVSFHAKIGWLVVQNISLKLEHGDKELKMISGYTDIAFKKDKVYSQILREFQDVCKFYKIDSESTLSADIYANQDFYPIVLEYGNGKPAVDPQEQDRIFGRKRYRIIPDSWSIKKELIQKYLEIKSNKKSDIYIKRDDVFFSILENQNSEKIWSSQWTNDKCLTTVSDYFNKYVKPLDDQYYSGHSFLKIEDDQLLANFSADLHL